MTIKAYVPVERALPAQHDAPGQTTLARGKRCTRCLCCDAVIAFDGEYLCAACDDGTHPPLPEYHPAPPIILPAPVLEPLQEEKPMAKAIDPQIKQAVLAEPPTVSNTDLARKYKISEVTVSIWRKAAGIKLVKSQRGPYKKRTPPAAPEPAPTQTRTKVTVKNLASSPQSAAAAAIDAWWAALSVSSRIAVFASNYAIESEDAAS